jgi:hypothetical protein
MSCRIQRVRRGQETASVRLLGAQGAATAWGRWVHQRAPFQAFDERLLGECILGRCDARMCVGQATANGLGCVIPVGAPMFSPPAQTYAPDGRVVWLYRAKGRSLHDLLHAPTDPII